MMLYKLLQSHRNVYTCQVISLTGEGPVAEKIRSLDLPVRALGMSTVMPNPIKLVRLAGWLREVGPDLVQTWMYHADLVGGLAAWLAGDIPLVWGIHNTTLDRQLTRSRTRLVVRANAHLSHWLPDQIISCSQKARDLHIEKGYDPNRFAVIPNGFNLEEFKPDPAAPRRLRSMLGLAPDCHIIGHVARFDPQKDYPTLLAAAAQLQNVVPGVHFVLCGKGVDVENEVLMDWVRAHGLLDCVHLLGLRDDMTRIMPGFDLGTLTSAYGEAFPNVIGEMMACEVPCVVTDVGDTDTMVGETGRVVAPQDPDALAAAWRTMLNMPAEKRRRCGQAARERVSSYFAMGEVSRQYQKVYQRVLAILPENET